MAVTIELLTEALEPAYVEMISTIPESLIFQTLRYRNFLRGILSESEDRYLIARRGGELVGALPAFVRKNSKHGNVLNSLPFFGSNGGVLTRPALPGAAEVQTALLQELVVLAREHDAVTSTVVASPLLSHDALYRQVLGECLEDVRIGQITSLPTASGEEAVLSMVHPKTRNAIRKAMRSGFAVTHEAGSAAMNALGEIHRENMREIGGTPKGQHVFEAIARTFNYDDDYRVYVARRDGLVVSALLVFFHNRVCEYFTPATVSEVRSEQPGSLLIFTAMREAIARRCLHWNWGGTWTTQPGVRSFKARWSARELPYRYFVKEHAAAHLRALSREEILREYPNYFVLPFSALE